MQELFKLAWRNLWRNKHRTWITLASIFFGVVFSIGMSSLTKGIIGNLIIENIESYSGYLQLQNEDYIDEPSLDNCFTYTDQLHKTLTENPNIRSAVPRIETFALASNGNRSQGVMVTAISPTQEKKMANPERFLVRFRLTQQALQLLKPLFKKEQKRKNLTLYIDHSYTNSQRMLADIGLQKASLALQKKALQATLFHSNYLTEKDEGILVSDALAKHLQVLPGDSLILMGQGYHGTSAATLCPIRGIIKVTSPDLDRRLIYMPLATADHFLGMEGHITSLSLNLDHPDRMEETKQELTALLPQGMAIRNWKELTPSLSQQADEGEGERFVILFILYIILFFGIIGTLEMMISERKKEFGMLHAIGMPREKIAKVFATEISLLTLIGITLGALAGALVIVVGYYHPIPLHGQIAQAYSQMGYSPVITFAWFNDYYWHQLLTIALMVVVATIQPVRHILHLDTLKSLHS